MKRSQIYVAAMSYNLRRTIHEYDLGVEIDRFCTASEMEKQNAVTSTKAFCNSLLDASLLPEQDDPQLATANYFLDSTDLVPADPEEPLRIPAVMHAPFNELHPAAIDPKVLSIAYERYEQAYAIATQLGIKNLSFTPAGFPSSISKTGSWNVPSPSGTDSWKAKMSSKSSLKM